MKTKTRILSSILACLMLLSALSVVSFAEAPAAGEVLFKEDYENALSKDALGWGKDPHYSGVSQILSVASDKVAEGSKSMKIEETAGNWCGVEMVPASAMQGVTKYVISAKMYWVDAKTFGFRFNTPADGTNGGDWSLVNWTGTWSQWDWVNGEQKNANDVSPIPNRKTDDFNDVVIVVDLEEKTVSTYINDMTTPVATLASQQTAAGAIYFLTRECSNVYIDDIKVTKGTMEEMASADVIYAENFESYENPYMKQSAQYPGSLAYYSYGMLDGSNRLVYTNTNGSSDNWTGIEIVPAAALEGIRSYTVQFDMKIETTSNWSGGVNFRFGSAADDASGNWLRFVHSNDWQNSILLYGDGRSGDKGSVKYDMGTVTGAIHHFAIEADADAKTVNVYMDGNKIISGTDTSAVVGGLWLICQYHTTASWDNLLVTSGTYAEAQAANPVSLMGVQDMVNPRVNQYAVRFAGLIHDYGVLENCTEVGFKVTAGEKNYDTAATAIYDKLTGSSYTGIAEEYTAANMGGAYIYALTIYQIPLYTGEITFTVQPYYVTASGTVYGTAYDVVYNAGVFVSMTPAAPAA